MSLREGFAALCALFGVLCVLIGGPLFLILGEELLCEALTRDPAGEALQLLAQGTGAGAGLCVIGGMLFLSARAIDRENLG